MKYKLSKRAWESIGKLAGWTKSEEEKEKDIWNSLVTCNWTKIAKALYASLSRNQKKWLIENERLPMDGFEITVFDEYSEDDLNWLDVDIDDIIKFREYLRAVSPELVMELEDSIPEFTDNSRVDYKFRMPGEWA